MPAQDSSYDSASRPTRKPETDIEYAVGGQLLLDRAMRLHPTADDPVDAFIRLCDDPKWVLRSSTTRTYKAQMIKRIEIEVEGGRCEPERAIEGIKSISDLLEQRRGKPPARTSRLKCKETTREEVQFVSADLLRRIIADEADIVDHALRLFVEFAPRLGLRPCEWDRARLVGGMLIVLNAKHSNHRAPGAVRQISLERAPEQLQQGVRGLMRAVRTLIEIHASWERARGILAERLARICSRLGLVRISLYSLRHAAIASWKRAKISRVEIAAMAGHISIKTASRHYARSKRGWDPKIVCVKAEPHAISVVRQYSESGTVFRLPEPWLPPVDWSASMPSMALRL